MGLKCNFTSAVHYINASLAACLAKSYKRKGHFVLFPRDSVGWGSCEMHFCSRARDVQVVTNVSFDAWWQAMSLFSLEQDVGRWTERTSGCPCYFDVGRRDCACCAPGGCQCGIQQPFSCVMCGMAQNCALANGCSMNSQRGCSQAGMLPIRVAEDVG